MGGRIGLHGGDRGLVYLAVVVVLEKCRCGTIRHPEAFKPPGQKAHKHVLRCPACGFKGYPGYTDDGVRKAWNEALKAASILRPTSRP